MSFVAQCFPRRLLANAIVALTVTCVMAQEADVNTLVEQNRQLVEQVRAQQRQIDELRSRLDRLDEASSPIRPDPSGSVREIRLSAEVGLGFFDSGSEGDMPNAEFRVDDARIFIEAAVWRNVYFYTGLELTTREVNDEFFHVGELYADFEDVWSIRDILSLSLRAGRFNIPFGEEYLVRNVMDNPLISHSLADLWGIDEGVQAYGKLGSVRYNLAVQNGGRRTLRDFDSDKAVVARLALDVTPALTLSLSAMRTGELTVAGDAQSEIWFGSGLFRSIGSAATTRIFSADLAEVDAAWRWSGGHLKGAAGWVSFDDDSTAADNSRELTYYSLEGMQRFPGRLFAAARYSAIDAPDGYPLAGQGNAGKYFFSSAAPLTEELRRLSVGLGYRFGDPIVWKVEYSWETGRLLSGAKRTDSDLFSSLLGLKF